MEIFSDTFPETSRFEPVARIGRGGFGVVFKAFDRDRGTYVALKVLRHVEGSALYRFKREFRAVADLPPHPNRVTLHELLTDGQSWFFTMELVDGDPLTTYVRPGPADTPLKDRRLDVDRLRAIIPQLVEALGSIHRAGIVHRDIKPSNVLVTADGRLVLLDFGLVSEQRAPHASDDTAEASQDGLVVLGTPSYMAPEQGARGGATPLADWYSVGAILYELLARTPFRTLDGLALPQRIAAITRQPSPRSTATAGSS